ncbi:hypothetical protein EYF80_046282 [Liparis tanakae]|uniref:Uncharacterized protein n=1 Tax=Liparis tanakae TaxID=230148 RepID=A0A4Z2FQV7_9TELE|nr:hypothetical protein EYF80_046282 [Liparis tanakae]
MMSSAERRMDLFKAERRNEEVYPKERYDVPLGPSERFTGQTRASFGNHGKVKSTKKGLKVRSSAFFAKPSPFSSDRPTAWVTQVVIESGTSNRSSASPVSELEGTRVETKGRRSTQTALDSPGRGSRVHGSHQGGGVRLEGGNGLVGVHAAALPVV